MINTVLIESAKVSYEEDFNPERLKAYITRHFITKHGDDTGSGIALDKVNEILNKRNTTHITREQLAKDVQRAINYVERLL